MEEEEEKIIKITNDFWPRWSEKSINEIDWGKETKEPKKKESKKSTAKSPKLTEVESKKTLTQFTDNEVCILPKCYQQSVYCWKRPNEMFEDNSPEAAANKIQVLSDENSIVDLHEMNAHLKNSSYYTHILDCLEILKMYKLWKVEDFGEFGFQKWQPFNHIYSEGNVKLGTPHHVTVNSFGKYAIRIFYCGTWRQIIIDDRIPVNKKNEILMPCIRMETSLQLWPLLITKAILKINFCRMEDEEFYIDERHTPQCKMYDGERCNCKVSIPIKSEYLQDEINLQRINIIYALTGWFPYQKNFAGQFESDVWEYFTSFLDHYKIPEKKEISGDKAQKKGGKGDKGGGKGKKGEKGMKEEKEEKGGKAGKAGKTEKVGKDGKEKMETPRSAVEAPPVVVKKELPLIVIDVFLWKQPSLMRRAFMEVLCTQYKDTPLFEEIKQEELPLWKTFRWIYWAMEKDIWQPYDPSKYYSLFCSLPKSKWNHFKEVLDKEWGEIIIKQIDQINEQPKENPKEILDKPKEIKDSPKKGKGDKTKKKQPKEEKVNQKELTFPNDHWVEFIKILEVIQCVKEFQKVHSFEKNFIITDEKIEIEKISIETPKKKQKEKPAKKKKNEPAEVEELPLEEKLNFYIEKPIDFYFFIDEDHTGETFIDLNVVKQCPEKNSTANLSIFKWYCITQKKLWTLSTNSLDGVQMEFPKGRKAYKLQLDIEKFTLRINTHFPLKIGYFNDLLEWMNSESQRFLNYFENIKNAFFKIIESIGEKGFVKNLQNFYHSLLEGCDENYRNIQVFRQFLYGKFIELLLEFLNLLKDLDNVRNIKRLLIYSDFSHSYNPELKIGSNCLEIMKCYNELKNQLCDCETNTEPYFTEQEIEDIRTCAAVIIQAAMKRYYVNLLQRYHSKAKKQPQDKINLLKNALKEFFEKYLIKESNLMFDFFRVFFFNDFEYFKQNRKLEKPITEEKLIGNLYEFFHDFKNSLHVTKYPGIIEQGSHWIPLKIGCFYCHSNDLTKYILHTSSDSPPEQQGQTFEMFTKVIKCDDLREVPPAATDVPYLFTLSNQDISGYKVLTYMYSEEPVTQFNWSLKVGFPRHVNYSHFCNTCGINECHCPNDVKTYNLLQNYILNCEKNEMQDLIVFQNHDILLENSNKFVCQIQIFNEEQTLIFGFFKFSGVQDSLRFNITLKKQNSMTYLIKKTFTDRVDFWKSIGYGFYELLITYEYESDKNALEDFLETLKAQSQKSCVVEDSKDVDTLYLQEEEYMSIIEEGEENQGKELGEWEIKLAYEEQSKLTIS